MNDYRPELLATAGSIEELEQVIAAGADAVAIGETPFGMRLPGNMPRERFRDAVRLAHDRQAKVYVAANSIMDHRLLSELPDYLAAVRDSGADALVFGDPAVYVAARSESPAFALHWNAEMTSTNFTTANYWANKGAARVVLARELNIDEIFEIKQKVSMEVQVQVHGMTNIYHSKRDLLQSYAAFLGGREGLLNGSRERGMYLTEKERPGQKYPVFEDETGTHIMSSDDVCMIENIQELLEEKIDSFKIESVLKTPDYNAAVVSAYRQAIDAYLKDPEHYVFQEEWLEAIQAVQDPDRELSYGFFYKEQVY